MQQQAQHPSRKLKLACSQTTNFADVVQLQHYNADACRGLVNKGLVQARQDDFGALTVALSEATKVTSRLALRDPTPLPRRDGYEQWPRQE